MKHFLDCPDVYLHREFTVNAPRHREHDFSASTASDMKQSRPKADDNMMNASLMEPPSAGMDMVANIEEFDIMTNMKPGSKILVIASAGLGKSSFSSHIVRLWSETSALQEKFNLVLLLPLRLVSNHCGPIENLFCKSNEYNLFPPTSEGQLRRMLKFNSRKVLFIFDGYDEIPERNQKQTVINDVISGKVASEASVIVTSRPQCEDTLFKLMSEFVSISLNVMSDQTIDRYINEIHQASQDTQYTSDAMENKIWTMLPQELLRIPLFLSFACFLWQMGNKNARLRSEVIQIKSIADVLGQVLGLFISLYVEKLDMCELPIYTSTLDDKIPTEIKLVLAKIHEMCFECFILDTFIFTHDALSQYGLHDQKVLEKIGFLDVSVSDDGKITAQCAHLLIQEFCAGMHLAERFKSDRTETKELREIKGMIVSPQFQLRNIPDMQMIIFAISVNANIVEIMSKKTMRHPIFHSDWQPIKDMRDGVIASKMFHYSFDREAEIIEVCKNKEIRQQFVRSLMAAETFVPDCFFLNNKFAPASAYECFFRELGPANALSLLNRRMSPAIEIEGSQGIFHANEKEQTSEVMMVGCLPLLHIVGAKELTISHCTLGPLLYTAEAWKKVRITALFNHFFIIRILYSPSLFFGLVNYGNRDF